MQEIRSLNPPVVTGICDPNKSRTRHRCSLKLGSKLKYLKNFIEITLRHGCPPVTLLHIFRTPFQWNTSEWLLLNSQIVGSHFRITSAYIMRPPGYIQKQRRLEVFLKKDVLKICSKFKGEQPCRRAISIKLHSNFRIFG